MARKKIKVTQIRDGKRVTFLTPDKGKLGKTPKEEQWYQPGVESGWKKDMPQEERRRLVLKAHKGDELSSARSMQAKANVTTDRETKQKARADAQYFFKRHRIGKGVVAPKMRVEKVLERREKYLQDKALREHKVIINEEIKKAGNREVGLKVAADRIEKQVDLRTGMPIEENIKDARYIRAVASQASRIPPKPKGDRGAVVSLQRLHAKRSTQARIRDEQQTHQVTIEVDSPRVKVWLKDPSAADIKGIDTPRARRRGTPRITPPTPKLRR